MASVKAIVSAATSFHFRQSLGGVLTTVTGPLGGAEVEWDGELLVTPPREVSSPDPENMYFGENMDIAQKNFAKAFAK